MKIPAFFALAVLIWVAGVWACKAETRCKASLYDHGKRTANGEAFRPMGMTAAHKTLPFGARLLVHLGKGRSVVVRINDRGPFIPGRCLDLSRGAARALGLEPLGVATVTYERLS